MIGTVVSRSLSGLRLCQSLKICLPYLPDNKVTIHILHDNTLTDDNRDKFNYIAGQYNQTVKFYNVEELCKDKVEELKKYAPNSLKRFTIGAWYRFLISDVLATETKKAIYLDSDVVVTMDIAEYWNVDLEDRILGVIPEDSWNRGNLLKKRIVIDKLVKYEKYFNSGSLLINLEKFRQAFSTIKESMNVLGKNPQYTAFGDQDLLNYCFAEEALQLPFKFNAIVAHNRKTKVDSVQGQILHYAMSGQLQMDCNDIWNKLFFKYFMKTPFHTAQTFGNINTGIQKVYNDQKDIMLRMINAVSGKKRLFYVTKDLEQKTRDLFQVKDDETVIVVDWSNPAELFRLTMSLGTDRGKIIHIFVAGGFVAKAKQHLLKQGFKEWQDFIDGGIAFGGNVNTNFIVNGM